MDNPLRLLIVEDNESDVEIMRRLISREGIVFVDQVVESKEDFKTALFEFQPDVILSDYAMPRFDGMRALLIRQEIGPTIPFILVTGSINEEVAVECMKAGADDYVLKQNLIRLVPSMKAALVKQETIRQRLEAETALRRSEERFKQIAELSGKFIWETDKNGMYTYVNKISEGILGYSSEEMVGKAYFYDFFIPEQKAEMKAAAMQFFSEKKEFMDFENHNIHKNGNLVILSTTGMPLLDTEGNLIGYRGVDTDITEQRKAELALRESEERFRNLYTHMGEGVCLHKLVFDTNGKAVNYRIVGVNNQYEAILSLKKEDVIGKLATEVYNSDTAPYLHEYQHVAISGIPTSLVTYNELLDKYFMISVSPWDKDGFATIFSDISKRVRAEEEIRQERLMLRTLIDHIPDTIYVKDAEGRKIIVNPAELEVIGAKSESEVIGKTDLEFFPGEEGQLWYADDMAVIHSGIPVLNREEDLVDASGKHRWFLSYKIPLIDKQGVVTGLVGIGHDITNRKYAEEQIDQKVKELAASNDELTRFNRLAIGRELRMIELKQHCNQLAEQLGIPPPYNLDFLKKEQNHASVKNITSYNFSGEMPNAEPES